MVAAGLLVVLMTSGFDACNPSYDQKITGGVLFHGVVDVNLSSGGNPKFKITDESDPKDTTRLGAYWCLPVENAAGVTFTARCDFALSSGYSQAWAVASKPLVIKFKGFVFDLRPFLDLNIRARATPPVIQKCSADPLMKQFRIDCAALVDTLVTQVTARKNISMRDLADKGRQCAVGSVFVTVLQNGTKSYPGLNTLNPAGAFLCTRQVFRVTGCLSAPIVNETCQTLPLRYE